MRKFLIASHGTFSKGAQSSLDIIIGHMENVFLIQAYLDENKSIEEELAEILQQINNDDELIIFTDLLGGSITNQAISVALKKNVHIISGFNLPLLIDMLMADQDTPVAEQIENSINNAKEQIVHVNKMINTPNDQRST